MPGPPIRTDIIDVYIFRATGSASDADDRDAIEWLQLRRAKLPLAQTWHPVMGHLEADEATVDGALRELKEETGYAPGAGLISLWQLESVNSYFIASLDCVVLSPGFAAKVERGLDPVIDGDHDAFRWVADQHADAHFMWPGQRRAVAEIRREILSLDSLSRDWLRIDLDGR